MPHRNLLIIVLAATISLACYHKAPRNRYLRTLTHAMGVVHGLYVEEVETRQLFEDAMEGMMSGLDPYSSFINRKSFRQFQESLDQEFGGIGIVVEGPPRTERLTVVSPIVNTPAYNAGLRAGDVILEIDGVSTEGMRLEEAVTHMRGPQGAEVELLVRHESRKEPRRYRLRRDTIPIESVLGDSRKADGSWSFLLEENPRLGYIRVTSFGEHTAHDLAAALEGMGPVEGLILDLRGNAGGLLTAAVATCDMFIAEGDIVSTRGRGGEVRQRFSATPHLQLPPQVPMVVLANQGSASASEIVAACLKDHGRAIVVGERTWGKGTVQNIVELEGGRSAMKLTTASYWRPSGHNIHRREGAGDEEEWGVRPSEGFEVVLSDAQVLKLIEARRDRDIVPGKERSDHDTDDASERLSTSPAQSPSEPTGAGDERTAAEREGANAARRPAGVKGEGAGASSGDEPRDEAAGDEAASDEAASDEAAGDEAAGDTSVDPQLRKAIEYLEGRIRPLPAGEIRA